MFEYRRILVVDQDADVRSLISSGLRDEGFAIDEAVDGFGAAKQSSANNYNLVIISVELPDMSGLDLARRLRRTSNVPVMLLSQSGEVSERLRGFRSGADDIVTKPFDAAELVARVIAIMRRIAPRALGVAAFHFYCPRCITCIDQNAEICGECGKEAPRLGWRSIEESDFEYLGRTIDERYVLDKFLGAGAVGWVYRARAKVLRRSFACKIVDSSRFAGDDVAQEILARYEVEVDAMSRLRNPHIVSVYESVVLREGVFALFMDLIEGQTLQTLVDQTGRIAPILALELVRQVANGLHEAHEIGIVHRDLKPANIMVEALPASGFFVLILDFGVARVIGGLSATQGFLGTPQFASPEQCLAQNIDRRSDIYSLGCVLHTLLTTEPPFTGPTTWDVLDGHVHRNPASVSVVLPGVSLPPGVSALVSRMLQKRPDDRPEDMRALVDAIDVILEKQSSTETQTAPPIVGRHTTNDSPTVGSDIGTCVACLELPDDVVVSSAALGITGREAVVAAHGGPHSIADLSSGLWSSRLRGGPAHLTSVAIDESTKHVFGATEGGDLWAWNPNRADAPRSFASLAEPVACISLVNLGAALICGTVSGRVVSVRRDGDSVRELHRTDSPVAAIACVPGGAEAIVGTADGRVRILPLASTALSKPASSELSRVKGCRALAVTRDGYLVAVLDDAGMVTILNAASGQPIFAIDTRNGGFTSLAFDDDAQLVALGVVGGTVTLWRLGPQSHKRKPAELSS